MEDNRRTMFECSDCRQWFHDMEEFVRHPCMTGQNSTQNQQDDDAQQANADPSQDETVMSTSEFFWTRANTLLLIQEMGKRNNLVDSGKLKKKDMFSQMSKKFNDLNVSATTDQVSNKWKSLLRGYKAVKDNNRKTGASKKTHPYENELDEILATDPNVTPPYVCSSAGKCDRENDEQGTSATKKPCPVSPTQIDVGSDASSGNESCVGASTPKVKKTKTTQAAQLVTFLHDYVDKQDKRHEEDSKRMESMHNEKMGLLKNLIDAIKK